jgi:hypothetical protein
MIDVKEFKKLKYQVLDIDDKKDISKLIPDFGRCKEIASYKGANKNEILKYFVLLYDPKSPLIEQYHDIKERKYEAAVLAGFRLGKDGFSDSVLQIIENKNPFVVDIAEVFLTKIYHGRKYREYQVLYQELDEYSRMRHESIKETTDKDQLIAAEKKTKLRQACIEIHEQLDKLEKEIFGDNDDMLEMAIKSRYMSPERYASVLML